MTSYKKILLPGIIFLFLTGCASATPSPTVVQITNIPTKEVMIPTITRTPTNTPIPCPPRLETELPNPDIPENYVGRVFRTLPESLEDIYGGVIGDVSKETDYKFVFVEVINNNTQTRMLWFEKFLCENEESVYFEVIDILSLPFDENEIVMEPGYCSLNDIPDPEIFALGNRDTKYPEIETMKQVWRANQVTEKFEELSIDGVTCRGEDIANEQ